MGRGGGVGGSVRGERDVAPGPPSCGDLSTFTPRNVQPGQVIAAKRGAEARDVGRNGTWQTGSERDGTEVSRRGTAPVPVGPVNSLSGARPVGAPTDHYR